MQKFLRKSRKWSALLIGMVVMTLLTVLVIGFLEKAMRLGKNIGGIERSVQAYYAATANIEATLQGAWEKLKKTPWEIEPKASLEGVRKSGVYNGSYVTTGGQRTEYDTKVYQYTQRTIWQLQNTSAILSSSKVPMGIISPFSSSYNLISLDKPVQLVIPKWVDWNNVQLEVRIPEMMSWNSAYSRQPRKTSDNLSNAVILWTFGNSEKILHATEEGLIAKNDISDSKDRWEYFPIILGRKQGEFYESIGWGKQMLSLADFYTRPDALDENCDNFSCVLKLSMLRPVETEIWEIPFLEYKITFNRNIPHQYAIVSAMGRIGDYLRTRSIQIPQITTNTALDFAVLQ